MKSGVTLKRCNPSSPQAEHLGQDDRNDEGRSERHELDLAELFGRGERLADEQDRQGDQELQGGAGDCDGNRVTITQLTQHEIPPTQNSPIQLGPRR